MGRGGLTVCGVLSQCSVRGHRALKNAARCGFVLEALLLARSNECKEWASKSLGGSPPSDTIQVPASHGALGHGLLRLCRHPSLPIQGVDVHLQSFLITEATGQIHAPVSSVWRPGSFRARLSLLAER
jgi:hypothetical protein